MCLPALTLNGLNLRSGLPIRFSTAWVCATMVQAGDRRRLVPLLAEDVRQASRNSMAWCPPLACPADPAVPSHTEHGHWARSCRCTGRTGHDLQHDAESGSHAEQTTWLVRSVTWNAVCSSTFRNDGVTRAWWFAQGSCPSDRSHYCNHQVTSVGLTLLDSAGTEGPADANCPLLQNTL